MKRLPHLALLLGCLLLSGCASYISRSAPGVDLHRYKKVFVENNLNDNHRIELILVNALQALGLEAQSGPPTMKPSDAQAVLRYADHWTWDFSEHISGMDIQLFDARSGRILASAHFSGPLSLKTSAQDIAKRLVKELFKAGAPAKKP